MNHSPPYKLSNKDPLRILDQLGRLHRMSYTEVCQIVSISMRSDPSGLGLEPDVYQPPPSMAYTSLRPIVLN